MKTFKQFLNEFVRKNVWTKLLPKEKSEYHKDIIRVVDKAYEHTSLGSFVKSLADVEGSDWEVLDYDEKEDIDVAIFMRKPRASEPWRGRKIQGIGHDGEKESKKKVISMLISTLNEHGYWIEASDAMAVVLRKNNVPLVKDQEVLKKLFPSITKFNSDGSYIRTSGGQQYHEAVFGKPF